MKIYEKFTNSSYSIRYSANSNSYSLSSDLYLSSIILTITDSKNSSTFSFTSALSYTQDV